jgi:lipopolysaccharide/colanic/teichoic acid biosynthesis glycosyltransferase
MPMAKRLFDLLLSLTGLLLLSPLMLALAAWIKLDSPGPVFFRQERVGRFGVPFRIHKFSTMTHARRRARCSPWAPTRASRVPEPLPAP